MCVTSRGLRIQGPARAPGPGCTTWGVIVSPLDARGVVSGKKKVKSQPRGRNSPKTSTPAAFGIHSRLPTSEGSAGFDLWVCLQIPWEFFFSPPGGAAFGASWIRVAPFFGTIPPVCAHFISAVTFFFFPRKTICKVSQEAEAMFCRNQTARATVARGSALEMEIRRGKFRKSVFQDTSQVH